MRVEDKLTQNLKALEKDTNRIAVRKALLCNAVARKILLDLPTLASQASNDIPEVFHSGDLPDGWRKSVVMSINDTRDELKRAHQSVTKLRRQLTEIDKRRSKRRVQIAASLERAESLLAEFQNAWR